MLIPPSATVFVLDAWSAQGDFPALNELATQHFGIEYDAETAEYDEGGIVDWDCDLRDPNTVSMLARQYWEAVRMWRDEDYEDAMPPWWAVTAILINDSILPLGWYVLIRNGHR